RGGSRPSTGWPSWPRRSPPAARPRPSPPAPRRSRAPAACRPRARRPRPAAAPPNGRPPPPPCGAGWPGGCPRASALGSAGTCSWHQCPHGAPVAPDHRARRSTGPGRPHFTRAWCGLSRGFAAPALPAALAVPAVCTLDPRHAQFEVPVPFRAATLARGLVLDVPAPVADRLLAFPVGDRDAEPIGAAYRLHPEETGLPARQLDHAIGGFPVALRHAGARGAEDHGVVRRLRQPGERLVHGIVLCTGTRLSSIARDPAGGLDELAKLCHGGPGGD